MLVTGVFEITTGLASHWVNATTSRAKPFMLKQSARLGVIFKVIILSSSDRNSRIVVPTVASAGKINKPSTPSSGSPNSLDEHNMPFEVWPRILVGLILKLPGNTAPGKAHGTLMPTCTLGAPHTICNNSPVPAST